MSGALVLLLTQPDGSRTRAQTTAGVVDVSMDRYPRWGGRFDVAPDPALSGIPLWQTPYGTRAEVQTADGSTLFVGPVIDAETEQPSGLWRLTAADDTYHYRRWVYPESKPQRIGPGTGVVSIAALIGYIAADAGLPAPVVAGAGGSVDLAEFDAAGQDGWRIIDEQATADGLEVTVNSDGSFTVAPPPELGAPVGMITVGESGTIISYRVRMTRRFNRVVITNVCKSSGNEDRYVDGVWEDTSPLTGVAAVGPAVRTANVQRGADWWADPAAHQGQADAAAAAAAPRMRGDAREVTLTAAPDYTLRPGQTITVGFKGLSRDLVMITACEWDLLGPMRLQCRNPEPGGPEALQYLRRS